jgi:hypothetical protein
MNPCEERAREAAKNLADAVNEMSFDVEAFADELLRQHRTIQQNTFGAFLATVKAWAGLESNRYDLRNEFTAESSRKIVEALGEYGLKPPFI